ncbi:MFS transporter [Amycolatopsis pigmentata]|uniref:MFS transporter n=1 Tax=Amycolatopsis pigmentata TaxID=450801 RepID=A0ABW5G266_9PSEU
MTASSGPSALGLLRDRRFAKLITSSAVNAFANQVALLAIPLVAVLTLKASPFQVAAVTALSTAAFLLVGLPAGALVDRLRPRAVIAVADGTRSLVALTVPVAWWAGHLSIWLLYAVAFTMGIANVFGLVARQSYLPLLVTRSDLTEGNAKLAGIEQVFRLGGPGLAGQVIAVLTAPFALVVTCASLALSAAAVLWIPESAPTRRSVRGRRRLIHEVGVGLAFVFGNRLLRAMAISVGWSNLFGLAYSSMMTIYLANWLRLTPAVIGLVMSVSGAGGIVGALVARRLSHLVGQGPLMWLSMLVGMPFLVVLPLVHNVSWVWAAAVAYAIAVCCMVVMNIVQGTVRQTITPPALLGRVSSTFRFLTWGTSPVGAVLGGLLGSSIGPRATLLVAAVGTCVGFVPIFRSPLRRMREIPAAEGVSRCDARHRQPESALQEEL